MKIINHLKTMIAISGALWEVSMKGAGVHYHIATFTNQKEYEVIWSELHAAQIRYERRLKALAAPRDKHGRYL